MMSRYLITFDMDTHCLKSNYHGNTYTNAYYDIRAVLEKHGFENLQGSVYLGKEGVSEAHGTIAIQEITAKFDWFFSCTSNIKFYRIESDLNADFIAERVYQAKQRFNQRLEEMRLSLLNAGVDEILVESILGKEVFSLENPK